MTHVDPLVLNRFVDKLRSGAVVYPDPILYHGTTRPNFEAYLRTPDSKIVYFSLTEQQSEYHIFDGECERGRDQQWDTYPSVYRLRLNRAPVVVQLGISVNNDTYYHTVNGKPLFEDEDAAIWRLGLDLHRRVSPINCVNTMKECNRIIVLLIAYLQKNLGINLDGYYCPQDEDEMVLVLGDTLYPTQIEAKRFNLTDSWLRLTLDNQPTKYDWEEEERLEANQLTLRLATRIRSIANPVKRIAAEKIFVKALCEAKPVFYRSDPTNLTFMMVERVPGILAYDQYEPV